MAVLALQTVLRIKTTNCCSCGCVIGMEENHYDERLNDHRSFWCPNGHSQHFTSESEAEKNARLLREEQDRHKRTLARENELLQEKNKLAKKLQRVDNGVCPECKRTFQNLARHMACKHNKAVPLFGKRKIP